MSLHSVEIRDGGPARSPQVFLDGQRVRGVTGYDVSKRLGENPEITIRLLAADLNQVEPDQFIRPYIAPPAPETETPAHQGE